MPTPTAIAYARAVRYAADADRLTDDGNPHHPDDAPAAAAPAAAPPEPARHECPNCGTANEPETGPVTTADSRQGCDECVADCALCGRTFLNDDLEHRPPPGESGRSSRHRRDDDHEVCPDCRDTRYAACERCDQDTHEADQHAVGDGVWCDDCYGDSSECESCGDRHPNDSNTWHEVSGRGAPICEACFDRDYFRCRRCRENRPDAENTGGNVCSTCSPPPEPDAIRDYGYQPAALTFHGEGRHYGVELETAVSKGGSVVQAAADVVDNLGADFAYLKKDSSIQYGEGGFEIVTHPATLDVHRAKWPAVLKPNSPADLVSHDAGCCGLHVHVERDGLTDLHVGKIVAFVNHPGAADFVQKVARRTSDRWAKLDPAKTITEVAKHQPSRYVAVNLQNEDTIEFRIFKGTLKPESFFRSLEFVDAVVEHMRPVTTGNAAVGDLPGFFRFVAANRKRYPFLHPFCERFQGRDVPDPKPEPTKMSRYYDAMLRAAAPDPPPPVVPDGGGARMSVRVQLAPPLPPPGHPDRFARATAALARLARPGYYHGTLGTSPTTHWADRPPAPAAPAVAHPGVIFPRYAIGTGSPTLHADATVSAPPAAADAALDKNARHHRERAAAYHGLRMAGLPAGGGTAPGTPGGDLLDYVQTLARAELATNPEWADRYRTAAARLAADDVPMHHLTAVGGVVRDAIARHLPAAGEDWNHPGDPGLLAAARRVIEATKRQVGPSPLTVDEIRQHGREAVNREHGADAGLFPLSIRPVGDAAPVPTVRRPPKAGPGEADHALPFDPDGATPMVPPARDLPAIGLAGTPRRKAGTPFDPKVRRQFVADHLANGTAPDVVAAAYADRFGVTRSQAEAAVRRFGVLRRPPAGRYDPPLALARLRELAMKLKRKESPVRNMAARPRPDYSGMPDIVAHAAYCLDNPHDSGALLAFADHAYDKVGDAGFWPDAHISPDGFWNNGEFDRGPTWLGRSNDIAGSFLKWVNGEADMLDSGLGASLRHTPHMFGGAAPAENGARQVSQIKPNHRLGDFEARDYGNRPAVTDAQRAMPQFERPHGATGLWDVTEYRPGNTHHRLTANETRKTRRKASSYHVAAELFRHGGIPNLIHAVIGAWHFRPERADQVRNGDVTFERFSRLREAVLKLKRAAAPIRLSADRVALIRAGQDRPHDTTPHLVLADYYDDHGLPGVAEVIRRHVDSHEAHSAAMAKYPHVQARRVALGLNPSPDSGWSVPIDHPPGEPSVVLPNFVPSRNPRSLHFRNGISGNPNFVAVGVLHRMPGVTQSGPYDSAYTADGIAGQPRGYFAEYAPHEAVRVLEGMPGVRNADLALRRLRAYFSPEELTPPGHAAEPERFAKRKRTRKQCKNRTCKRNFLSVGEHHAYCSPRCRLSSQAGYRDGYVRGKRRAAVVVGDAGEAAPAPTKMARAYAAAFGNKGA